MSGWTSLATASYVTATTHLINDDWEMLKTKELKESHTAENVDIKGGSVIATTKGNATNYINAVETSSNGKYTMYGAHNKLGCAQRARGQSH